MQITSSAFGEGENIPSIYTCDGENVNPPLTITDVPQGTRQLVLIVDDPDATAGVTWVHWTVWNIAPNTTEIHEGKTPEGAQEGVTSFDEVGYGGPCPPPGAKAHRYFFKLLAVDLKLDLPTETTAKQLESAMVGHILAQAELVGLYARS